MVVDFSAKQLFGCDPAKTNEKIGDKFIYLSKGFLSFPLNIPGTAFHKCLKIRKVVTDSITATLKERLASSENYQGDLLDHLLRDQHAEKFLSEDFIVNIVFGLLLASSESISVTVTLVLKFLAENPQALEELLVEHEGVMKNRENPGSPLTWNEVKSMNFTLHDLEPDVISKNFMPFGGGTRKCAGAEFAKVLIITFLHVLLTKYRWWKIKGGDITQAPIVKFPNGLHIKVVEGNTSRPN
ncbi:hypothetical protein Ancab_028165 [Ancistrocladus abbreviatus]